MTQARQEPDTAAPQALTASVTYWLLALLLLALLLRIGLALAWPTLDWPDEIFQTTEPAHRLAFGNGVVTWEWRDGLRNWALPGFFAAVMRLTAWMAAGSAGYLRAITVLLAALSLTVVWVAFRWGARLFGAMAGIAAAATCALWYDLVYYGPKPLYEVIAAHLLVASLYLGYWSDHSSRPARLLACGILLGVAVGLRVQLAPAVLVALVFICYRLPRRQRTPLLLGGALTFLAFGLLDAVTWSHPFVSYYGLAQVNLVAGKAAHYGVAPWDWYLGQLLPRVGWLLPFSVLGTRRSPMLAAVAGAVLATHSVIAHKEYRYVYPAVVLIVFLGALGVAEAVAWCQRRSQRAGVAIAIAVISVALVSYYTWSTTHMASKYNGALPAFAHLSRDSSVCGVGLRGHWHASGGYTYLHRDVALVPVTTANDAALSPAFNVLVTTDTLPAHPAGFQFDRCYGQACIYRRAGPCAPDPKHEINAYLRATGQ